MSESEPTEPSWASGDPHRDGARRPTYEYSPKVVAFSRPSSGKPLSPVVAFDRHELREILGVYGRKVAEGEWRDYAIDYNRDRAVFSIYRRTSEMPLYRIEKEPKSARRQGAFSVVTAAGQILKRGHDLKRVIAVLDTPVRLVVS